MTAWRICSRLTGSSPRMRGTRHPYEQGFDLRRFIPAYAGNTGICQTEQGDLPVHPRVCGEHGIPVFQGRVQVGSSPRMRGTPLLLSFSLEFGRFIPAYAGNTSAKVAVAAANSVHPRVCGEHWR